jgi:hypothetical protein
MDTLDIMTQISNLKNIDYRNTLAISTLIELLIEKDIFSRKEFSNMANFLDKLADTEIETAKAN